MLFWTLPLLLSWSPPEKANLPPAELRRLATDVVVGEVQAIYTREETGGGYRTTHAVAEVKIVEVEKGDSLVGRELVYVRYWHRRWVRRSAPPTDTNGHRGLPEEGETLRIYLARHAYDGFRVAEDNADGGYNVIGANGFERLARESRK